MGQTGQPPDGYLPTSPAQIPKIVVYDKLNERLVGIRNWKIEAPDPVDPKYAEGQSIDDLTSLVGAENAKKFVSAEPFGITAKQIEISDPDVPLMARKPHVLTCQQWIEEGRYLLFRANPSEVGFTLPQRSATQKTRMGEILHIWKDRERGTYYDEPQLQVSFQSGNIMPYRMATDGSQPEVPPGLSNFYEFLELVDTQKIMPDGRTNFVYWVFNSRIFPEITFVGLFTPAGVTWSDSAQDPNQVTNWSATFTVYDVYPPLNNAATLMEFFRAAGFGRID